MENQSRESQEAVKGNWSNLAAAEAVPNPPTNTTHSKESTAFLTIVLTHTSSEAPDQRKGLEILIPDWETNTYPDKLVFRNPCASMSDKKTIDMIPKKKQDESNTKIQFFQLLKEKQEEGSNHIWDSQRPVLR